MGGGPFLLYFLDIMRWAAILCQALPTMMLSPSKHLAVTGQSGHELWNWEQTPTLIMKQLLVFWFMLWKRAECGFSSKFQWQIIKFKFEVKNRHMYRGKHDPHRRKIKICTRNICALKSFIDENNIELLSFLSASSYWSQWHWVCFMQ